MHVDKDTIIRAWKSREYHDSLPPEVQQAIPPMPTSADGQELDDKALEGAAGGVTPLIPVGIAAGTVFVTGMGMGAVAEDANDD